MDQSLKTCLDEVSEKSSSVTRKLAELIKEKLTQPSIDFFQSEPGKEFIKRVENKLFEKATGFDNFDNRDTPWNLDFPTSEEVESIMGHKDEITNFLKNEVGIEILYWYQNMAPMQNSTFITMKCAA